MANKSNNIELFRNQSLEIATRPQLDIEEYFDVMPGYEDIRLERDSSIYQSSAGEAIAFRMGPLSDKDLDLIKLSELSNQGKWSNGPPSSVGRGVLLANDPRCFHFNMMGRMNPHEKDIYVVALGKKIEELHFGSKEDESLGVRSLGAIAANASALSPAEFPYLQGMCVDIMQRGAKDEVFVFKEKLFTALANNSQFKSRWLLAKGESISSARIVGSLKS